MRDEALMMAHCSQIDTLRKSDVSECRTHKTHKHRYKSETKRK